MEGWGMGGGGMSAQVCQSVSCGDHGGLNWPDQYASEMKVVQDLVSLTLLFPLVSLTWSAFTEGRDEHL